MKARRGGPRPGSRSIGRVDGLVRLILAVQRADALTVRRARHLIIASLTSAWSELDERGRSLASRLSDLLGRRFAEGSGGRPDPRAFAEESVGLFAPLLSPKDLRRLSHVLPEGDPRIVEWKTACESRRLALAFVEPWRSIPRHLRERAVASAGQVGAHAFQRTRRAPSAKSFLALVANLGGIFSRLDDPRLLAVTAPDRPSLVEVALHAFGLRTVPGVPGNYRATSLESPLVKVAAECIRKSCAASQIVRKSLLAGLRPTIDDARPHLAWAVVAARLATAREKVRRRGGTLDLSCTLLVAVIALVLLARRTRDRRLRASLSLIERVTEQPMRTILRGATRPLIQARSLRSFLRDPLIALLAEPTHVS